MTAIRGAAAITGAASGIGRALAIELARRGCDLALADRDEPGLKTLAAEIGAASKLSLHRVDVSKPDDIAQFAREAATAHPALGIVVNNAGVALMGSFEEIDQAQMDWLFDINFWGVVHGTRAFLPHLKTLGEAHIVNLSSIFGIIAPPGQSAYAAAAPLTAPPADRQNTRSSCDRSPPCSIRAWPRNWRCLRRRAGPS